MGDGHVLSAEDIRSTLKYHKTLKPFDGDLWEQERSSVPVPGLTCQFHDASAPRAAAAELMGYLPEINWTARYAVQRVVRYATVPGSPAEQAMLEDLSEAALNAGEYREVVALTREWQGNASSSRLHEDDRYRMMLGRQAKALRNMGDMYAAIDCHRQILGTCDAQGARLRKAATFRRMGKVYQNYAQQVELSGICVDLALKELELAAAESGVDRDDWLNQYVRTLDAKGQYLLKSSHNRDPRQAMDLFRQAAALQAEMGGPGQNTRPVAHLLQAELAEGLHSPAEAEVLYRRHVMRQIEGDERALGVRNLHYAIMLDKSGRTRQALERLEIAGEVSRRLRDYVVHARVCLMEARLQPERATEHLRKAWKVARRAGLLRLEMEAIRELLKHLKLHGSSGEVREVSVAIARLQDLSRELIRRAKDIYANFREGTEFEFRHLNHREQLLDLLMRNLEDILEDSHQNAQNFTHVSETLERVGRRALDAAGLEMASIAVAAHLHDLGHRLRALEHCEEQLARLGAEVRGNTMADQLLEDLSLEFRQLQEYGEKLRAEARRYTTGHKRLSMEDLLEGVYRSVAPEISGKSLVFDLQGSIQVSYVWWFERVLENLIRNAGREIPERAEAPQIRVTVRVVPGNRQGRAARVELSVENRAAGPEGAERLRLALESAARSDSGGAGVGIILTHSVFVEKLGADYRVDYADGYTRLTFSFRPEIAGLTIIRRNRRTDSNVVLVSGPRNCGKSAIAEQLVTAAGGPVVYVGTLPKLGEHLDRIRRHRQQRPAMWPTVELIGDLEYDNSLLAEVSGATVLYEGMATYVHRCLFPTPGVREIETLPRAILAQVSALARRNVDVVVVSTAASELPADSAGVAGEVLEGIRTMAARRIMVLGSL